MHKFTTDELVSQKPSDSKFRSLPRAPISFILHNIRSLQNVGLFFRLADAIRAEKIYLTGFTGFPRLPSDPRAEHIIARAEREINKTAIKLVPFVPWERHEDVFALFKTLRASNHSLVGVEQTDASINYQKASYRPPLALLFGHEREGLEEKLLEFCDLIIHIPMLGMGNSHNVAVSGAIISSHIQKLLTPEASAAAPH